MKPFKIILFTTVIVVTCTGLIHGQTEERFSFETEFFTKFSIGDEVRVNTFYDSITMVNYPKQTTYDNPAFAIMFTPSYAITEQIKVGISSGIAIGLDEHNPLTGGQYYDRVMIPVNLRLGYEILITSDFSIVPEGRIGYQFSHSGFGNTAEGFIYVETGGLLAGLGIRFETKVDKYTPSLSIGYELNRLSHEISLGFSQGYDYDDKFKFDTDYHLISVSLGIGF